ncbi:MAG: helix-turn-helix transcriptional regulator [Ruminococcus flavefaciens]|nr:helix-turn-helix transcriptional regulator [Ruminococcus flavefaciens]MCM1062775.1 helix-turn-helix transcriptional regulator [Eubacterium sp.]
MIKCHLKTILKEHNLSQKELCDLIKARPSTICDWCNNNVESVKLKLLEDICTALGCEISDILTII